MKSTRLNKPSSSMRQLIAALRPAYARDLAEFARFLEGRGACLEGASAGDARVFVEEVLKPTYAISTIARKVSELRQIYKARVGCANPFDLICISVPEKPGTKNAPPRLDPPARDIATGSVKQVRDAALLALAGLDRLLTCQLRAVNIDDVDLDAGTVTVRTRGKLPHLIFLSQDTLPYLRRWLAVRRRYQADTEAVFISLHWTDGRKAPFGRLSERGIYAVRAYYARRIN